MGDMRAVSVRELRSNICNLKFCEKLLVLLKFTRDDLENISQVGIAWCRDELHFICNTNILALFLNIKTNSLNKNLRHFGFVSDPSHQCAITSEFGRLPDIRNWKVRHNSNPLWGTSMNASRMIYDQLPSFDAFSQDTIRLMDMIDGSASWKRSLVSKAALQWTELSKDDETVCYSSLVEKLLEVSNPSPPREFHATVSANIKYLLSGMTQSSQTIHGVSFIDFLNVFVRFGMAERIAYSIYEVSHPASWENDFFEHSLPSFASWFVPSHDQNEATMKLKSGIDWVVRMTTTPNLFTVQKKCGKGVIATNIKFDAIATDPSNMYTVKFDSNEISRASLLQILVDVLGVQITVREQSSLQDTIHFVTANFLVQ